MYIEGVNLKDTDKDKVRQWLVATFGEENEAFLHYPWPRAVWLLFFEFLQDLKVGQFYFKKVCRCCDPELYFTVTDQYAFPYEYLKKIERTKMCEVRQFFLSKLPASEMFITERYIHLVSFTFHYLPIAEMIAAHFYHKFYHKEKEKDKNN